MTFKEKLIQNFIDDNRYMYLVKGLGTTLKITFFALLLGVALGFIVAVIRTTYDKQRKHGVVLSVLNFFCKIYLTVIRGTPAVVQLLVIYYIIFATSRINPVFVASLSFGINSGAYVAEIVRSGIMSVDNGQFEAGRSLGLSYLQTMWIIIAPQAFKNILPALANEFITLLKETSISGYIGINDLTRGGDIIRSVTYEPFVPLITVALIYLAMVMVLTWLVGRLERRLRKSERH